MDIFRHGVLNAHAGDLPRYRGNACPNWAILAGEPYCGLCIHQMVPELDAGPVVLRDRLPLSDNTYIGDVYSWLADRIPAMLAEAVDQLADGLVDAVPQPLDPALSMRCYPRKAEDSLIDWNWSSDAVLRMIRASSKPFAGAFTYLEGREKVIVWRAAQEVHSGDFLAVPGQVCFNLEGDPVIACGSGMLRLTEIEAPGAPNNVSAKKLVTRSNRNRLTFEDAQSR